VKEEEEEEELVVEPRLLVAVDVEVSASTAELL